MSDQNGQWAWLFGTGLKGAGLGMDFLNSMEDLTAQQGYLADDRAFQAQEFDWARQDLGSDYVQAQGMAMANAGTDQGISAQGGNGGAQYQRQMDRLQAQKDYQDQVLTRKETALQTAKNRAQLGGLFQALGLGVGAAADIAENNWFGGANRADTRRGYPYRNRSW